MDTVVDWLTVEGSSMSPFLDAGDSIGVQWTRPESPTSLVPGELIVGRGADRNWVVHRFIGRDPQGARQWLIKGDAALSFDRLAPEEIWGRVVALKRSGSHRISQHRNTKLDRVIAWLLILTQVRIFTPFAKRVVYVLGKLRREIE